LPLYGALTFFSSLNPQPDPNTHLEAWARYVTTDFYLLKHLFASGLGLILVIFGTIALGAYLATSRAGRMGLGGDGQRRLRYPPVPDGRGVSIFAAPKQGQAILAGIEEYEKLPTILADTALLPTMGVGVLLMLVGNVLLGRAVWRSGTLPRWAGALWVAGSALPLLGTGVHNPADRRRQHPADGAHGSGAAGDRRGVDGLERPAPTLRCRGGCPGPTERVTT
jgi:hypothetical protein